MIISGFLISFSTIFIMAIEDRLYENYTVQPNKKGILNLKRHELKKREAGELCLLYVFESKDLRKSFDSKDAEEISSCLDSISSVVDLIYYSEENIKMKTMLENAIHDIFPVPTEFSWLFRRLINITENEQNCYLEMKPF